MAAASLVRTTDGLRTVLDWTVGEHHRVKVRGGDPVTVGL
jgi:hypothetical protein